MYKITARRLTKALPILNQYCDELHRTGGFDSRAFEMELRACWNVGYQEMKELAVDLMRREPYRFLAAYYMENSNGSRQLVASEFKDDLASFTGWTGMMPKIAKKSERRSGRACRR